MKRDKSNIEIMLHKKKKRIESFTGNPSVGLLRL